MTKNLITAMEDIAKVEAIMYAIEKAYLDIETVPEDREKAENAINAFYALWDAVRKVSDDIERLEGDSKVVDAIRAVREIRRACTLEIEN